MPQRTYATGRISAEKELSKRFYMLYLDKTTEQLKLHKHKLIMKLLILYLRFTTSTHWDIGSGVFVFGVVPIRTKYPGTKNDIPFRKAFIIHVSNVRKPGQLPPGYPTIDLKRFVTISVHCTTSSGLVSEGSDYSMT